MSLPLRRIAPANSRRLLSLAFSACAAASCGDDGDGPPADDRSTLPGGTITVVDRTSRAFEAPAPGLADAELRRHFDGDRTFAQVFVTPPAGLGNGLGPMFNHSSCNGCHVNNGRGLPQFGGDGHHAQALVRVSVEGRDPATGDALPFGRFGTQLQDRAVEGVIPEVSIQLEWEEVSGQFGDRTPYVLRRPRVSITLDDGSPLPPNVLTSMRIAPPVVGLGLLEAIPEDRILALADPDDADGDGISGRANRVWNPESGRAELGRFGHKANTATLRIQAAAAYFNDMGVTSPLFPDEDGTSELSETDLDSTVFYTQTLGVPAPVRRGVDADAVRRGRALFDDYACASCHVPSHTTGPSPIGVLAGQTIWPWTDLLLHDLGPELQDWRPDFDANGREWRTPPLWGIGLTGTILPGAGFLHDGRATTLGEAILWHGGEAEASREAFRTAPATDRDALVAFLQSL